MTVAGRRSILYENDVTGIKVLLALNVSLNYLYIATGRRRVPTTMMLMMGSY